MKDYGTKERQAWVKDACRYWIKEDAAGWWLLFCIIVGLIGMML